MSSDSGGSDALAEAAIGALIQQTGLPAPVASGLISASNRLLGGMLAYPTAWIQRAVQGVQDGTTGRSHIRQELAKAAAVRAVADPAIVERAMWSMLDGACRKQANKEAVVAEAVKALEDKASAGDQAPTVEPDSDWMNVFERYAEDASSERMRELWGRVLAGELRSKGSFSLSTLRFMSELSPRVAADFQAFSREVVGDFAPFDPKVEIEGERYRLLDTLQSAGLITGIEGSRHRIIPLSENGFSLYDDGWAIKFRGPNGQRKEIFGFMLTQIGEEIIELQAGRDVPRAMRELARIAKGPPLTQISIWRAVRNGQSVRLWNGEVLWRAEDGA